MERIQLGIVSAIEAESGMVQVTYADTGATSDYLPYLTYGEEYHVPKINTMVLVVGLSSAVSGSIVIGGFWNKKNLPPITEDTIWKKQIEENVSMEFAGNVLTIKAPNIVFDVGGKKINILDCLQGGESDG